MQNAAGHILNVSTVDASERFSAKYTSSVLSHGLPFGPAKLQTVEANTQILDICF